MIIKSLMDTDFYKFTMGHFVFHNFPNEPVEFELMDRGGFKLATIIDENNLREELESVQSLRFTKSELHYLRGTNEYNNRMFSEEYLEFLSKLRLPDFELSVKDGDFILRFSGRWSEVMYWETLAMSIINEMRTRSIVGEMSTVDALAVSGESFIRLKKKVDVLRTMEELKFIDFGTRRRFNLDLQREIVYRLKDLHQFCGTSNTRLAMDFDLLPMGTYAHELDMGYTAIYRRNCGVPIQKKRIVQSHLAMMNDWYEMYGKGLSVALTDTYGSDFFFDYFDERTARNWKGVRHDSGCPFKFGEKLLDHYRSIGIDPKTKLLIFSDGLDLEMICKLYNQFKNDINLSFGWGTNLTNDTGIKPLNIVVKMTKAAGIGTVKLSDNIAKAMGSAEDIALFKEVCC